MWKFEKWSFLLKSIISTYAHRGPVLKKVVICWQLIYRWAYLNLSLIPKKCGNLMTSGEQQFCSTLQICIFFLYNFCLKCVGTPYLFMYRSLLRLAIVCLFFLKKNFFLALCNMQGLKSFTRSHIKIKKDFFSNIIMLYLHLKKHLELRMIKNFFSIGEC